MRRSFRPWIIVRSVVLTLLALSCALGSTFLVSLGFVLLSQGGTQPAFPVDCALVFGTAIHPRRDAAGNIVAYQPGPGILRRVSKAVELYTKGQIRRMYVSGGRGDDAPVSEARVMATVARELGVPEEEMVLEEESRSTWENIAFTHPLMAQCRSVVAVSDSYHVGRIRMIASIQGWNIETVAADSPIDMTFIVKNWLREAAALVALVLQSLLT